MKKDSYFRDVDFIRLIACISVLLYHLTILKGGFLAVCIFFVLSGYLSCVSAFKEKDFSFKEYYIKKITRLYIPLLAVVFITVGIVSLIPNISWINLKPETTSVLLGYNNYWQLNASLNYFARHIDSPFMHLWYISILLQFDLVFPFIFVGLRKLGDNIKKIIPCILTFLIALLSCIYLYIVSTKGNLMVTYYDSFARMFSLLLGLFLGFVHSYYGNLIFDLFKKKVISYIIFVFYLILLIGSFIFIGSDFKYLSLIMIGVSLITCRLIDYGILNDKRELNIFDKILKSLSKVSYEFYLIQYPIIFLLQYIKVNVYLNILIVIIGSLIMAYILHYGLDFKYKDIKFKFLKIGVSLVILCLSIFGAYRYVVAKDYHEEMDKLEQKLADNEILIKQKQEEYMANLQNKKDSWAETISDLEYDESRFNARFKTMSVVGIGDSVMLGAASEIYRKFPNSYIDAEISRTAWVAKDVVLDLKKKGLLEGPIVFGLGTNGDCSEDCKVAIIKACGEREIFWINVINDDDVHVNDKLAELATKYDNFHVIDWEEEAKGHSEYFIADGIHLTTYGIRAYTQLIYDSIYKVYYDDFNEKKEEILNQYKEDLKSEYIFLGNDILINAFNKIQEGYPDAKYVSSKEFSFTKLKEKIEEDLAEDILPENVVLVIDKNIIFTTKEYQELITLCKDKKVFIVTTNSNEIDKLNKIEASNLTVLDMSKELSSNSEYLDIDGIHLTDSGNDRLVAILKDNIK